MNNIKIEVDEKKKQDITTEITKHEKELEALKMILSRVDTYRRNTFNSLRNKENIESIITHIRIYKEQRPYYISRGMRFLDAKVN